jgi:sulfur carrier protein ThiS
MLWMIAQWSSAQCISGDCENGKGEYSYKNGDVYSGQFVDGVRQGIGEIRFSDGAGFVGEFRDGAPEGRGILTYSNGSKYLGYFSKGLRSGYGVKYSQEGDVERCGLWEEGKLVTPRAENLVLRQLGLKPGKANPGSRLRITKNGVEVVDEDNHVKKIEDQVVVDPKKKEEALTAPEIQILQPTNVSSRGFKVVSNSEINVKPGKESETIKGIVKAAAILDELRVNGRPVVVAADGSFSAEVRLLVGKNEIYIVATDKKGQRTEKVLELQASGKTAVVNLDNKKLPQAPANQKRLALIIGNSSYNGGVLRNPVNDVRAMEEALQKVGFDVMKYEDLDLKGTKKAIENFGAQLPLYDVGLFFYAGHGLQINGTNYIVPVDVSIENEQDAAYECIETSQVINKMESAQCKVNIVILDACRNNPFEKTWTRSEKGSGLASIDAPADSFVAYATAPGTTASDGSGDHGLYTEKLLQYISSPGVSIEEVFRNVRKGVIQDSNKQQIPWDSSSLTDAFYFK